MGAVFVKNVDADVKILMSTSSRVFGTHKHKHHTHTHTCTTCTNTNMHTYTHKHAHMHARKHAHTHTNMHTSPAVCTRGRRFIILDE